MLGGKMSTELTELERLKQELAGKDAAIKVLMGENDAYKQGLVAIANSHANDYQAACANSQRTWEGSEHDFYVTMRKLFEREWKRAARLILGNDYDSTTRPHHFPKHDGEDGK